MGGPDVKTGGWVDAPGRRGRRGAEVTPDVQRVCDELEIRNLVAELSQLADTASEEELERYLELFTDDATWVVQSQGAGLSPQVRTGRKEILEGVRERRAAGIQGPGTHTRHAVSTLTVKFETGDRAVARCYWHYYTDASSAAPVLALMGEYRNTFVRTPQGWRLERRELVSG
jgi:3-phenylpropionate/cinnamic acid dioxygenase small subunit